MKPQDMLSYWRSQYPESEPIAYKLRDVYHSRWVRFHSLPESKRYAECDAEYQTIFDRHNQILETLAEPNETLAFVSTGYSKTATAIRDEPRLNELDPSAEPWHTVANHAIDDNSPYPNYWHLFVAEYNWVPGVFDSILRLVADDAVANTMILSTTNHWIYHPYDGGADVIVDTADRRDQLEAQFAAWLSSHSDGL